MKKKGKILSILAVLALVLSLAAVIPAGFAGAQTAGTVQLNRSVYSLSAATGTDSFSATSPFNVVKVRVTDADVNVQRTGVARFDVAAVTPGATTVFDINKETAASAASATDDAGPVPIIAGEKAASNTFNGDGATTTFALFDATASALASGTADTAASATVLTDSTAGFVAAGVAAGDTVFNTTDDSYGEITAVTATTITVAALLGGTANTWTIGDAYSVSPAVKGRDANDDGALTIADVSAKVSGISATIGAVVTGGVGNNHITKVTLAAAPAAGTDNVVISFETSEYDIATPANTPISFSGTSIKFGATFAAATSSKGVDTIDSTTGQVTASSAVAAGQKAVITFAYDVTDSIAGVAVKSNTSIAQDQTRTINLAETTPSSGVFEGTITLEAKGTGTATKLEVSDGDTITATYADASPSADLSASATTDLTPPTLTLVSPAHGLYTTDTTPTFTVEVSDAGAPITDATTVDLVINGAAVTEAKTAIVNGFRLSFLQATALADQALPWWVTAKDAVGNDVAGHAGTTADPFILGSSQKKYKVTIDTTKVSSITSAKAGFGVNAAGTDRTRSDNTGIEVTFSEPIQTSSVAASDFDVVGSSVPNNARHFATLKNTESFTAVAGQTNFAITEFAALDTDSDGSFADEYTVTVNGVAVTPAAGSNATTAVIPATAVGDAVKVTYTYDSSAIVYLTVDPLASSAKPVVKLTGDVLDLAGNSAATGLLKTSVDDINPTITTALSDTLVGDPDNDGISKATLTITSDEALAAAPTVLPIAAGGGTLTAAAATAVTGSTNTWTSALTGTVADDTFTITATGTDAAGNAGTSTAVTLKSDITNPALTAEAGAGSGFDPAAVATGATPNTAFQGLDDIARAVANFAEGTTVTASTLSGGDLEGTVDVSAETFAEKTTVTNDTQILAKVLPVGEYTWKITVSDDAGNSSGVQTLVFKVAAPTTFTIPLEPGWNLISVPSRLDAATPAKVFGDTAPTVTKIRTWTTDGGWQVSNFKDGAWSGDILALKQGVGYWVFSTTSDDVTATLRRLSGVPQAPRPQAVTAGWNLVGPQFLNLPAPAGVDAGPYFSGIDWAVAYIFDPDPAVGFTRISPPAPGGNTGVILAAGAGVWVYANADGQIVP